MCTGSRGPNCCDTDIDFVKRDKNSIGNNDSVLVFGLVFDLVNSNEEFEVDNNLTGHHHDRPSVIHDNRVGRRVSIDSGNHDSIDVE